MGGIKRNTGFTLIELLVALAVAGILATTAVPAYKNFIANQRVKTASQALFSSLLFARSEAIKRNGDVSVVRNGSDWADGWSIRVGAVDLRKQEALGAIAVSAAGDSITFNRTGRADASDTFAFCDADGTGGVIRRSVAVDTTGRPNIGRSGDCSS